tara:strand:+ start:154 stop:708 length:555 start_codon:yes stop_codon:yes gene_type:complete
MNRHRNRHRNRNLYLSILITAIILGGYFYLSDSGFQSLEELKSSFEDLGNSASIVQNKNGCPNNIIPDNSIHFIYNFMKLDKVNLILSHSGEEYWGDGIQIQSPDRNYRDRRNSDCLKGSAEGENVNFWYCKDFIYQNQTTPISEEGVVGETTTTRYLVDIVLKKDEGRDDYYFITEANCKKEK